MKQYLDCQITRKDGTKFSNPLTMSESRLITKMAKENLSVTVTVKLVTKEQYKQLFN